MKENTKHIAELVSVLINLAADIAIGYAIGHRFHSFAIGFTTYSVLAGLSSINHKLSRRP